MHLDNRTAKAVTALSDGLKALTLVTDTDTDTGTDTVETVADTASVAETENAAGRIVRENSAAIAFIRSSIDVAEGKRTEFEKSGLAAVCSMTRLMYVEIMLGKVKRDVVKVAIFGSDKPEKSRAEYFNLAAAFASYFSSPGSDGKVRGLPGAVATALTAEDGSEALRVWLAGLETPVCGMNALRTWLATGKAPSASDPVKACERVVKKAVLAREMSVTTSAAIARAILAVLGSAEAASFIAAVKEHAAAGDKAAQELAEREAEKAAAKAAIIAEYEASKAVAA